MSPQAGTTSGSTEHRPRIVIGSLTRENTGSIPTITLAFLTGLGARYDYRAHHAHRRFGLTRTARLSFLNGYYFVKHFMLWIVALLRHRPDVVHYPVTSGWNLEKSMIFLHLPGLFGVKTVGHLNGGAFDRFWEGLPRWRRTLGQWCIRRLDVFLVTSSGWSEWSRRVVGVEPHRVSTVVNPIDGTFEAAALAFPPTESTDLFFVGAIGKRKGAFDLVQVAGRLGGGAGDTHMHIAGPEDRVGDDRGSGTWWHGRNFRTSRSGARCTATEKSSTSERMASSSFRVTTRIFRLW